LVQVARSSRLITKAHFTIGIKVNVQFNSNQAFLLVQKVKINPKGFTLGDKVVIEKIF
jgi:hypothetical protein